MQCDVCGDVSQLTFKTNTQYTLPDVILSIITRVYKWVYVCLVVLSSVVPSYDSLLKHTKIDERVFIFICLDLRKAFDLTISELLKSINLVYIDNIVKFKINVPTRTVFLYTCDTCSALPFYICTMSSPVTSWTSAFVNLLRFQELELFPAFLTADCEKLLWYCVVIIACSNL